MSGVICVDGCDVGTIANFLEVHETTVQIKIVGGEPPEITDISVVEIPELPRERVVTEERAQHPKNQTHPKRYRK